MYVQKTQTWVVLAAAGAAMVLGAGMLAASKFGATPTGAATPNFFTSASNTPKASERTATPIPPEQLKSVSGKATSTAATLNSDLGLPTTSVQPPKATEKPAIPGGVPQLPNPAQLANAQALGAGIVTYDKSQPRDWSDIDRWYKRRGRSRAPFTGEDRIHRFKSGNRQTTGPQPSLNSLLSNGMVLENDPETPSNVIVVAYHNITRMYGGAVQIDGVRHNQPLMGIHAPEVPGDRFTWLYPVDGKVAEFTFKAVSNQLIPDQAGEYEKLFTPATSGKPLLVTYKCHPAGSMAQRRVTRWELESAQWSARTVEYVK